MTETSLQYIPGTTPIPPCWLEVDDGDFTSIKDLMSLVVSLYRCGIWTEEEREGLLRNIAGGSIQTLPESAYSRFYLITVKLKAYYFTQKITTENNLMSFCNISNLVNGLCFQLEAPQLDVHLPRIAIQYGSYLKNEAGVRRFLTEVQLLLRYLNGVSVFAPVDGVISELTVEGIRRFQRHQNQSGMKCKF